MTKQLCSWLIAGCVSIIGVSSAHAASRAAAGFQKLQTLVGDWEGKDEHGGAVKTRFKPIAGHTAVMETLSMS
jgi:hypothetical protein